MPLWKQLLFSLVVIAAGFVLWARFFPGAPEILARWGLEWVAPGGGQQGEAGGAGGDGPGREAAAVVTAPISTATINDRLVAIGTSRALNSVSVMPFSAGRLTEIAVESGAHVSAGDVIARIDSDAEEIALDRARIALEDASARLERVKALRTTNTVTAVQLTEAELAVSNARLAVRDAELTLERRSILAPISGIVGIIPVSVGNHVTTQTVIATIDDRSRIVVDFWVPERFAGMVSVGQPVSAAAVARPDDGYAGVVSAVDSRIESRSRTLQVQASIDNARDLLRAGMAFQIEMHFPGDTYPAVDPLAVQWGADGAFVWLIEDGVARRVGVRIVQRNTDSILVSGELGTAGQVVTEGIHAVREGAPVRLVGGEAGQAPTAAVTGS
ncbi:MAG: efflux transporter periplasmic adaptor subunit [Hyphomicrobiales bacterium]|nr:MAG: efflux transporter periplasmic adaptor subunit [Hyphomicrobiales bacterium]